MNTTHRSYGWLALILAILLIFVLYLLLTTRSDLRRATTQFRGDISMYSNELIRECTLTATTTVAQRSQCERMWEGFAETVKDYGKAIVTIEATSSVPGSRTTPTTTSTTSTTTGSATTTLDL
jgi:hypothetical protein